MILLFHNGQYIENSGICSSFPEDNPEWLSANKEDIKTRFNLSDEDFNNLLLVVLDSRDPANNQFFAAIKERVPTINDTMPSNEEKEYDEVETGEVARELEFTKVGKIKKDKDGEYVYKETRKTKLVPKAPYNRNRDMLLPVEEWGLNERRQAVAVKKARVKELYNKLLLQEATEAERAEYKTLKNIT